LKYHETCEFEVALTTGYGIGYGVRHDMGNEQPPDKRIAAAIFV
jgi:hypothetical protein